MSYLVGLSKDEISEDTLNKSGLKWKKVNPRETILSIAPSLLGVPYKFGASVSKDSPNVFDCSSLTAYLYTQGGVAIPRVCDDQYKAGDEVPETEALPGDLVFYKGNRTDISKDKVGHVGVYMGEGDIIHAGGVSIGYGKVVREKITESKYYPSGFLGYRRLLQSGDDRFVVEIPEDRPELRDRNILIKELKSL